MIQTGKRSVCYFSLFKFLHHIQYLMAPTYLDEFLQFCVISTLLNAPLLEMKVLDLIQLNVIQFAFNIFSNLPKTNLSESNPYYQSHPGM